MSGALRLSGRDRACRSSLPDRDIAAAIERIPAQGFFPVGLRVSRCMAILLQVQPGNVEFLDRLDLVRRRGLFSGIRNVFATLRRFCVVQAMSSLPSAVRTRRVSEGTGVATHQTGDERRSGQDIGGRFKQYVVSRKRGRTRVSLNDSVTQAPIRTAPFSSSRLTAIL